MQEAGKEMEQLAVVVCTQLQVVFGIMWSCWLAECLVCLVGNGAGKRTLI